MRSGTWTPVASATPSGAASIVVQHVQSEEQDPERRQECRSSKEIVSCSTTPWVHGEDKRVVDKVVLAHPSNGTRAPQDQRRRPHDAENGEAGEEVRRIEGLRLLDW
eukprot:CAMPEP_0175641196 /NCGR_PEP_ID=MMETSP0097-20121207/4632_1 /TAXON_ID=311494 /ORGANISM="Alexandrium monilatum, Strain CCMP3105" /LENGTH=106 /DNA_ID=CAMNT_0016946957 /DNA_START=585 /DNA_END=906 /DNA_ORIENTATION=-